jgi:YVTN family beta-propeller protein
MSEHRKSFGYLALVCCAALEDTFPDDRSSTLAISPNGNLLAVVNNDSRSVTLVDLPSQDVRAEIIVGRDPRTVAFSHDGSLGR